MLDQIKNESPIFLFLTTEMLDCTIKEFNIRRWATAKCWSMCMMRKSHSCVKQYVLYIIMHVYISNMPVFSFFALSAVQQHTAIFACLFPFPFCLGFRVRVSILQYQYWSFCGHNSASVL